MKLWIVRHGDPDYSIDSLTEKGWREARYLSERLSAIDTVAYYVSPLGRAKDTASLTLQRVGRTATECEWLREFRVRIRRPDAPQRQSIAWDWLPQDWLPQDGFLTLEHWDEAACYHEAGVREEYDWVVTNLDALLERHGYRREGRFYRAVQPNNDNLVFFCHFGVTCVLLSHLLNISPVVLWHGLCSAPTSVTLLSTEERREGVAVFRMNAFGDTSHLYIHGEPPAFAGRFCECFKNEDERRD